MAAPGPNEPPGVRGLLFEGHNVLVIEPVIAEGVNHNQEQIGTIRILSDYGIVSRSLLRVGADMFALVLGIAVLVAIFLSVPLAKFRFGAHSTPDQRRRRSLRRAITPCAHAGTRCGVRPADADLQPDAGAYPGAGRGLEFSQKLEALIHSIDGIVWESNPENFHFTFVSRQCERLLGYPPRLWLDDPNFWHHLHPDDAAAALKTCHESIKKRQPYSHDDRMIAAVLEDGLDPGERCDPGGECSGRWQCGHFPGYHAQKEAAEQFEKLNQQLLETSRSAGMAEVATGVLHNVGNVLNSVNVSTTVLKEQPNKTAAPG